MRKVLFMLLTLLASVTLAAGAQVAPKEKKWWEKREERKDIYYPHNAHLKVMEQEGDSCMLCHTFAGTDLTDEKQLKLLTTLANEPLKAICHSCHVAEQGGDLRAPWRCDLCHHDKTKIWPKDHNFGYIQHHSEDARRDEQACRECHLDMAYCTNCHFRRDTSGTGYHPLGYRTLHGIEARTMPSNCARCHNQTYCDECHSSAR